jgi:hypothetical protein
MTSRIRQGARALVLDEGGELPEAALRCELLEEVGLVDPQPRVVLADETVHGVRWFTRAELAQGAVSFSPRDLADQVESVLANRAPPVLREFECLPRGWHVTENDVGER